MAEYRRVLCTLMQASESIYRSPLCYAIFGGTDCGPAVILNMLKDELQTIEETPLHIGGVSLQSKTWVMVLDNDNYLAVEAVAKFHVYKLVLTAC